jgi:excisionase family DNA binding protein
MRNEPKSIAVPVNEACQIAGIGRTLLYRLLGEGALESVAIGRRRLIIVASLERLLASDPKVCDAA